MINSGIQMIQASGVSKAWVQAQLLTVGGDFSNGGEAGGADRTIGNTDAFAFGIKTNDVERIYIAPTTGEVVFANAFRVKGNVGFNNASTFGTSAVGVLAIANGTPPTTAPADQIQMWAGDYAAGDSRLYVMGEGSTDKVIIGGGQLIVNSKDYGGISVVGGAQPNLTLTDTLSSLKLYTSSRSSYVNTNRTLGFTSEFDNTLSTTFSFSTVGTVELTASALEQTFFYIEPKVNQSSTAAYNGLKIDVTETALGDGSTGDGNNLINLALGGISKYRVGNDITTFMANTSEPSTPTGGGLFWVESGALKYKGSSGTVTTIAAA